MGKWFSNQEDAIRLHTQFYSKPFEIAPVTHLGSLYSWFIFGPSSRINCWDGYLSTDGEKIVITESGWMKMGIIKKQWILNSEILETIRFKGDKLQIFTHERQEGLTTLSFWEGMVLFWFLFFIPFFVANRKVVKFRLLDDFKNAGQVKNFIMKLNIRKSSQLTESASTCNNCGYSGKLQVVNPRKDTGIRGEMKICPNCGNTDK